MRVAAITPMFSAGGHARAAARAGDHGGHAVADEGPAHVLVQVLAGHGRHGLDVARVLGHQDDDHGHDQQHGLAGEHRRMEAGNAEPGGIGTPLRSTGLPQPRPLVKTA
jgi:hypothetical protein